MDLVSSEVSKVNVIFVGRDPVKMGFDLTLRNNEAAWKLYYVCIFLNGPASASFSFIFVFSNKHCNSYNK